ncbi:MAG TPA: flagellar protein FlgN [Steroidobacteraceae bacterium]|nr:flagellar protein FlgN [Steroidobacteraceae bacterium]
MDAALTRDTLQRLLVEENGALSEFESLLDQEHGALRSRDIDALEKLAESRQANVVRLLKIEDERRTLCSMLGFDMDLSGLSKLIAWCDPSRSLLKRYEECATRAKKCRELNDRNGILVGAQIKRVEGLLGAMTGTANEPRNYGPRGHTNAYSASAGNMLSAEA